MKKRPRAERKYGKLEPVPHIKGVIERLFFERREKFEIMYEKRRLRLQTCLVKLLQHLTQVNINVNLERTVSTRIRRKSKHIQLVITGIKQTGNVNWAEAKHAFEAHRREIESLIGQLQYCEEVAKRNQFGLHEFPQDIPRNFEALEHYIMTEGDLIIRTGKKRTW